MGTTETATSAGQVAVITVAEAWLAIDAIGGLPRRERNNAMRALQARIHDSFPEWDSRRKALCAKIDEFADGRWFS